MGIASNTCTTLKAPFVSMVLSIADQVRTLVRSYFQIRTLIPHKDRRIRKYPLELSIEEFHVRSLTKFASNFVIYFIAWDTGLPEDL